MFPIEINRAPLEALLRVPGIGARSAYKIMQARRYAKLDFDHLAKMRVVLKRARHFITCGGKYFGARPAAVRALLAGGEANKNVEQLSLFGSDALSALTGEL